MIIVGAGGFAKEISEVIAELNIFDNLFYFDNVNNYPTDYKVFNKYELVSEIDIVKEKFKKDNRFVLGLGNPFFREQFTQQLTQLGGKLTSIISPLAKIAKNNVTIGKGATILHYSTIGPGASIGEGALIYHNVQITHDCLIGNYVELSPNAVLLGNVKLGDYVRVGANATILPRLSVGNKAVVGAGAVVTTGIEDLSTVAGVPARKIN